ncbi:DUF5926 family protein [Leekyejoonella antrihumi]|nr:DUF5926 family protein [Leekyejoonella antrihumi]
MGKASRKKSQGKKAPRDPRTMPAPFARRPFEGLPGESELVGMREIIPAATATVTFTHEGSDHEATLATVLPMAWSGLHRSDGSVLVALQSGGSSGDASRDLAEALLATLALPEGTPLTSAPKASAASPRLQDLLTGTDLEVTLHEGFDFWVEDQELDADGKASLDRANEAVAPTVRLSSAASAYWCRLGNRCYVRWILPHDEDAATDALARLHAAGNSRLGDGRLLGAFRTCGLLVPVWEVAADQPAESHADDLGELAARFETALAETTPLTADERRARHGIVSRQVTLR